MEISLANNLAAESRYIQVPAAKRGSTVALCRWVALLYVKIFRVREREKHMLTFVMLSLPRCWGEPFA